MSDLHARLTARIDELAAVAIAAAQHEGGTDWYARGVIGADPPTARHVIEWDPATVLRGLAEDRDILTRHRPSAEPVPTPLGEHTVCVYCSDLDAVEVRVVGWPCWDAISLARRHGIEVPS